MVPVAALGAELLAEGETSGDFLVGFGDYSESGNRFRFSCAGYFCLNDQRTQSCFSNPSVSRAGSVEK